MFNTLFKAAAGVFLSAGGVLMAGGGFNSLKAMANTPGIVPAMKWFPKFLMTGVGVGLTALGTKSTLSAFKDIT